MPDCAVFADLLDRLEKQTDAARNTLTQGRVLQAARPSHSLGAFYSLLPSGVNSICFIIFPAVIADFPSMVNDSPNAVSLSGHERL